MSFDSSTRKKLSNMVSNARKLITGEFTSQMQEIYGIQPDGTIIEIDKLLQLDNEDLEIARALREKIEHIAGGAITEKKQAGFAINRVINEEAFTILNRFAALRMCEERGLIQETVRSGMQSKGFLVYSTICGSGLGSTFERYKTYLFCIFDEIAVDLGILFDRYAEKGILFPREAALTELLNIIDTAELRDLWTEDETIGWIYQYFNSKEEREAMRKASAAPRNSHELAVRNQFFTPRYVVEFLTDNTLGRTWYEMRKGETELKEKCRYLVRRPNEVFLKPGEEAEGSRQYAEGSEVDGAEGSEELSQEELLKQPVYISHRPKKDPREIRMLDPAGGSGHFGLYAFDLFEIIYVEAYDDSDLGAVLQTDYPDRNLFLREIPKMILEHNIHIIDIDPRAIQIAALALWLRAQKSFNVLKLKPTERPRITKTNVVCAEPMPGEVDLLKEFTASLSPRLLGQIVEIIFEKMKLAGEAGTLLKIEEEITDIISKAKEQWLKGSEKDQGELFQEFEKVKAVQGVLFDLSDITDEEFWEHAEEKILEALQTYAEQAENGRAIKRRLFAEDTAQGFAFIDLCRKKYDVVLMNPPFGEPAGRTTDYLQEGFSNLSGNILCGFIERQIDLMQYLGITGSVVDRTIFIKNHYESFRRNVLLDSGSLGVAADLGWGVLDANVEVSCLIFNKQPQSGSVFGANLAVVQEKEGELLKMCLSPNLIQLSHFVNMPFAAINCEVPSFFFRLLGRSQPVSVFVGAFYNGHTIKSDVFKRLVWEVHSSDFQKVWERMWNGSEYSPFYVSMQEAVLVRDYAGGLDNHGTTIIRNAGKHLRSGLCFGKRGDYLDVQILPSGFILTNEGFGGPFQDDEETWFLLAYLNSRLAQYMINLYCGQHKGVGYVGMLPVFHTTRKEEAASHAKTLYLMARETNQIEETDPFFKCLSISYDNVCDYPFELDADLRNRLDYFNAYAEELDQWIFEQAGLSTDEIEVVISETQNRPSHQILVNYHCDEKQIFSAIALLSYVLGIVFGRWDIRIALNPSLGPKLPDPFDPLPICPPGMLIGPDSLPAKPGNIVSEAWLRKRAEGSMQYSDGKWQIPKGDDSLPAALCLLPTDSDYPIHISWNGILVEDSMKYAEDGMQYHKDDIIVRIREVLDVLYPGKPKDSPSSSSQLPTAYCLLPTDSPPTNSPPLPSAFSIEQEASEILGVKSLRDYFRSPSGFFQDHLKRYSKSRRKAPIYWPLSTASGSYTLWIYYHRLNEQMPYLCITDYIDPKLDDTRKDIERLQIEIAKGVAASQRNMLEKLIDFEHELKDFRDELLRVAKLPYKPNLNDGVMITAAPLWKLFRLTSWRKDLQECWKKLEAGEYDWAHLAYSIWPDRVKEKCKVDKSIAIAHDLEHLYEEKAASPKKSKKSKNKTGGTLT